MRLSGPVESLTVLAFTSARLQCIFGFAGPQRIHMVQPHLKVSWSWDGLVECDIIGQWMQPLEDAVPELRHGKYPPNSLEGVFETAWSRRVRDIIGQKMQPLKKSRNLNWDTANICQEKDFAHSLLSLSSLALGFLWYYCVRSISRSLQDLAGKRQVILRGTGSICICMRTWRRSVNEPLEAVGSQLLSVFRSDNLFLLFTTAAAWRLSCLIYRWPRRLR